MQQCWYGTKICDIYDLQKCLTQTWVDFEQNVIEAACCDWPVARQSEIIYVCWCRMRNYYLFVLYASAEHLVKLLM